ncbi:putative ABC transporter ATP-binding protein YxlF [Planctomycetes bacterium Poly30]|uniref:Putative ABC transporter ATP-binding protein YxlF n=1 Tax=Saltatorellus ferox TaxID=2528018 RepID=A0A518ETS1_9BACT|nr:putative ABC transporter ATP-binding protein YxlF [Planctomycetes bacterium Poly30]
MIEVAHLTRRYGSATAVDDLSFEVAKGEVVGFLGPNGAGKTTTMRILAGYLPATRAERLLVAGHDVMRDSMAVRRAIGYLPESVPLYPELRVEEMMRFQGRLHRMSRQDLRTRIGEVLDRVGVLDRRKQLVGTLSRGLKQRVGLAVALLPDPEVLILDEPTSGLDPIQRGEVRNLIAALSSEHTVLLSSHILAEIEAMAPRVIIIHEGQKVADGSQDQIIQRLGASGSGGGAGHVLVEAAAPAEASAMAELMKSLPGVETVTLGDRVGIHHSFRVSGEGDLREDIGALAMTQGWALRELTWKRPTLEQIFTRLVIGDVAPVLSEGASSAPAPVAVPNASNAPAPVTSGLELSMPQGAKKPLPLGTPGTAQPKTIYSLNPFDRGASRDLSKPVSVDPVPPAAPKLDPLDPEGGDA